ncbi:hypothetical protein AN479_23670 [Serratia marcescens]|uniref:hypothetical protein n=1 Tax=Serratia marcescens TaxID=615 RepID=UPI0006BE0A36|nr:hypothetical protein [Serratia marcescens]ALD42904.1 hypothetical protein AN479_00085 [Serratia marcescens]ALD47239.1 hypothetical protein AN479_23670 [Serratia marcescens]
MNQQQILFAKNVIAHRKTEIAQLEKQIANPRSRPSKNEERRKAIECFKADISNSLKRLFDAGVIII